MLLFVSKALGWICEEHGNHIFLNRQIAGRCRCLVIWSRGSSHPTPGIAVLVTRNVYLNDDAMLTDHKFIQQKRRHSKMRPNR